jgi:hypothetical protein
VSQAVIGGDQRVAEIRLISGVADFPADEISIQIGGQIEKKLREPY